MDRQNRIKKIEEMEKILDEHSLKLSRLRYALDEFVNSEHQYEKLKDYYTSEEYLHDMESFDSGELPGDLKCGVLSQDAVFDLIGDNFNIAIEMLEIATDVIKNH